MARTLSQGERIARLEQSEEDMRDDIAEIKADVKKIVTTLADEKGGPVHSEKMVEVHFKDGVPVATGDQFGLGRKR